MFELLHFHFLTPEDKSSSSEITNLTSFIISYQSGALISSTVFHIPGVLGISELKWTGMGEFNSDDHYIYYCGQESLRRNGVAMMVNKRV